MAQGERAWGVCKKRWTRCCNECNFRPTLLPWTSCRWNVGPQNPATLLVGAKAVISLRPGHRAHGGERGHTAAVTPSRSTSKRMFPTPKSVQMGRRFLGAELYAAVRRRALRLATLALPYTSVGNREGAQVDKHQPLVHARVQAS